MNLEPATRVAGFTFFITAGISLTVSEPGSSDTFDVTNESVVADQDAWIDPIQTDMYRDNQTPAVFDLVRGDDSGTPQAPAQSQDIYFCLEYGGYTAGLVNSDGSITPIDPNAAYADFGITVAGQNGGVTYDPNTGLFKATIQGGQSTVELDFIPTNLFGPAGVNPFIYQVDIQGTVTDPNTQIGFDFNAPQTNPATQPAVNGALHGLVAEDDSTALDTEQLDPWLTELSSDSWQERAEARAQIEAILASDPSAAAYNQLYQDAVSAANQGELSVSKGLDEALRNVFPLGFPQLESNSNGITGLQWPNRVAKLFTGTNRIQLDVGADPGVATWNSPNLFVQGLAILYADGTPPPQLSPIPEIQFKPTVTGEMTITITVEPQAFSGGLFKRYLRPNC